MPLPKSSYINIPSWELKLLLLLGNNLVGVQFKKTIPTEQIVTTVVTNSYKISFTTDFFQKEIDNTEKWNIILN